MRISSKKHKPDVSSVTYFPMKRHSNQKNLTSASEGKPECLSSGLQTRKILQNRASDDHILDCRGRKRTGTMMIRSGREGGKMFHASLLIDYISPQLFHSTKLKFS